MGINLQLTYMGKQKGFSVNDEKTFSLKIFNKLFYSLSLSPCQFR